jgi:hypothetical protein
MQLSRSSVCQHHLATHGRTIHLGTFRKYAELLQRRDEPTFIWPAQRYTLTPSGQFPNAEPQRQEQIEVTTVARMTGDAEPFDDPNSGNLRSSIHGVILDGICRKARVWYLNAGPVPPGMGPPESTPCARTDPAIAAFPWALPSSAASRLRLAPWPLHHD